MRVFVYEYACAIAATSRKRKRRLDVQRKPSLTLPARTAVAESVHVEGRAMLAAVVEDFSNLAACEVDVMEMEDEETFRKLARRADWSLIIAPEFDELLETRCRWVEEAGGRLLGPTVEAVRVAGDKYATFEALWRAGVPTPVTWLGGRDLPQRTQREDAENTETSATSASPLCDLCGKNKSEAHGETSIVVKPRHGAGSIGIRLSIPTDELPTTDDWIVQPLVPGIAASVSFLLGTPETMPLLPAYQILSLDGTFQYRGGRIPLPEPLAGRAIALGRRAVDAIPGLRGYVGIDLVLGDRESGSEDYVIEINPRLTTSYVGLRALAQTNLAEAMVCLAEGRQCPPVRWRPADVEFQPDGEVHWIGDRR